MRNIANRNQAHEFPHDWVALIGPQLSKEGDWLVFPGATLEPTPQFPQGPSSVGLYLCSDYFTNGCLQVELDKGFPANSSFDIIYDFNPATQATLLGGIPVASAYAVRSFDKRWIDIASTGFREKESTAIQSLGLTVEGSVVSLSANGTVVLKTQSPYNHIRSQVGVLVVSNQRVRFKNFKVQTEKPRAFVIMQFGSGYDEVYMEVIRNVCNEMKISVIRIDENMAPGLIIADILNAIRQATVVIADITPVNANVFYELGFAHGVGKPVILLAEKGTSLPFDISPFRTLFYENSIGGKSKLDERLGQALASVLGTLALR